MRRHNGNYIIRVTAKAENGVGLTMGFMINADAYDELKELHSFDVQETDSFIYCDDTEYYRICNIIDTFLHP